MKDNGLAINSCKEEHLDVQNTAKTFNMEWFFLDSLQMIQVLFLWVIMN